MARTLNDTVRADVRLLIPSGNAVPPEKAARFDAIVKQAPDNIRFVPEGTATVLLPPPVYDLAETAERPPVDLPEQFYLTVFNPYGGVKGTEDLAQVVESAPHPFVWCHSQATVGHTIPDELANHPRIVHVEDATPEQLRYLYEHCEGYVSVSKTEGFGWSIADALRYSPAVFSRPVGVLTLPSADNQAGCFMDSELAFTWALASDSETQGAPRRDLSFVSAEQFRECLRSMAESVQIRVGRPAWRHTR